MRENHLVDTPIWLGFIVILSGIQAFSEAADVETDTTTFSEEEILTIVNGDNTFVLVQPAPTSGLTDTPSSIQTDNLEQPASVLTFGLEPSIETVAETTQSAAETQQPVSQHSSSEQQSTADRSTVSISPSPIATIDPTGRDSSPLSSAPPQSSSTTLEETTISPSATTYLFSVDGHSITTTITSTGEETAVVVVEPSAAGLITSTITLNATLARPSSSANAVPVLISLSVISFLVLTGMLVALLCICRRMKQTKKAADLAVGLRKLESGESSFGGVNGVAGYAASESTDATFVRKRDAGLWENWWKPYDSLSLSRRDEEAGTATANMEEVVPTSPLPSMMDAESITEAKTLSRGHSSNESSLERNVGKNSLDKDSELPTLAAANEITAKELPLVPRNIPDSIVVMAAPVIKDTKQDVIERQRLRRAAAPTDTVVGAKYGKIGGKGRLAWQSAAQLNGVFNVKDEEDLSTTRSEALMMEVKSAFQGIPRQSSLNRREQVKLTAQVFPTPSPSGSSSSEEASEEDDDSEMEPPLPPIPTKFQHLRRGRTVSSSVVTNVSSRLRQPLKRSSSLNSAPTRSILRNKTNDEVARVTFKKGTKRGAPMAQPMCVDDSEDDLPLFFTRINGINIHSPPLTAVPAGNFTRPMSPTVVVQEPARVISPQPMVPTTQGTMFPSQSGVTPAMLQFVQPAPTMSSFQSNVQMSNSGYSIVSPMPVWTPGQPQQVGLTNMPHPQPPKRQVSLAVGHPASQPYHCHADGGINPSLMGHVIATSMDNASNNTI